MPLSEFHRAAAAAKGKPESNQSDLSSFMPDNDDFVELLWENGPIAMQGQSNRPRKTSFPTPFSKLQEKEGRDAAMPKIGLFEAMDSTVNDLSLSLPVRSGNIGLHDQDDDMVPWTNYQVEDDSFCSEFFAELPGINPNSASKDRNNGFGVKDFHNVEPGQGNKDFKEGQESSRTRACQLFQQECQTSIPCSRPRVADFCAGDGSSSINPQGQFQKLDLLPASKPSQLAGGVMNFPHFSRPSSLKKANVEHGDRLRSTKEASSAAASTNPMESTLINSTGVRGNSAMDMAKRLEVTSRNNHHNNGTTDNNSAPEVKLRSSSSAAIMAIGRHEADKGPEAVVASSVCSGSNAGAGSNDPKCRDKRKNQGGEESEYLSEDLEDDSVGVKKPTTARAGMNTKRSRAAEVHNLSERRRRDRINEKMRALQELIPNCNKVDKASMLDEAIEYLKTLQLQVQMMSMGSGLRMTPMMLPPGMQHMRTPPMAHFSPMGVGMGMGIGMGYGMGMIDMNGSPGCPLIPVPPMHTPQFPCTSIAGATGLLGMPGSTGLQLFGIPGHGQGLPISMPRAQLFSPLPGLAAKGYSMNEVSGTMVHPMPVLDATPSSRCKDQLQQQQQNLNLEATQKASTSESQVEKESLEQPNLAQISNQALNIGQNGAVNSTADNDKTNTSSRKTSFG